MKIPIAVLALTICSLPAFAQDEADPSVVPPTIALPQASSVLAVPFVQIPLPNVVPPRRASGLAEIIRARFPLSIGFEDLGAGWREIEYGATYFTKGESVFIGDSEYLVAYRSLSASDVRGLNERQYVLYLTRRINVLRPGARLPITLLRMSRVQGFIVDGNTGLKSFDASDYKDTVAPPATSDAFNQNLSLLFLRKIGEAMTAYSSANLDVLPPLDNAVEARRNLEPFAENGAIFLQPGSRAPFRFNPILSGRKRAHLRGKSFFVIAYEGDAAPDGSRAVLRLNGSVLRVSDKMWRKMKDASKIE